MQDMELDPVEVFEDRFEELIHEFCVDAKIENMTTAPQNQWTACMMYIHKHMIKGTDLLKYKNSIVQNGYLKTNCNAYNIDTVYSLLQLYVYYCYKYSKEVSVSGFSKLSGIHLDTLYAWGNDENISDLFSVKSSEIFKTLITERENSNSDLLGHMRNPTGVLSRLNHFHNWTASAATDNRKTGVVISLDELAKQLLSTSQGQIEQRKDDE